MPYVLFMKLLVELLDSGNQVDDTLGGRVALPPSGDERILDRLDRLRPEMSLYALVERGAPLRSDHKLSKRVGGLRRHRSGACRSKDRSYRRLELGGVLGCAL